MAEKKEAKGGPDIGALVFPSPKTLLSRISDPATIFIALIAAALSFAGATVLNTQAPMASGLMALQMTEKACSSRFLIDAYPMPGADTPSDALGGCQGTSRLWSPW